MDLKQIRALVKILNENGLSLLEVTGEGETVRMEKQVRGESSQSLPAAAPAPVLREEKSAPAGEPRDFRTIKSPMVGMFYSAPSPDAEPFVRPGSRVKKGDVLCVIEAMKLMNEVGAEEDGEILEVCAENGQVVEYGQTLFKIR